MNERERTQQRYTTTFPLRLSDVCVWGTACCLLCWCSLLFWLSLSHSLPLSLSHADAIHARHSFVYCSLTRAVDRDWLWWVCVCVLACLLSYVSSYAALHFDVWTFEVNSLSRARTHTKHERPSVRLYGYGGIHDVFIVCSACVYT